MVCSLTPIVSCLAHSAAQALRRQQSFSQVLRQQVALDYLLAEQGSVCTVASSSWFGSRETITKVTLYSLSHIRVQVSCAAAASAIAVVSACKLNTQNAPSEA